MNIFRATALVLFAALIPGGLILLAPMIQRWVNQARARSRKRAKERLAPESGGSQV